MFLKASERVQIPFKFQSFSANDVTPEAGPTHPLGSQSHEYKLQTFGKVGICRKVLCLSLFSVKLFLVRRLSDSVRRTLIFGSVSVSLSVLHLFPGKLCDRFF